MKRALIIGIVLLLAVIVGIGIFLYNSIDSIVEAAIEKHGSRVLGTQVSVGSVDISLKSGRGTIRDVRVENPEGFSSGDLFELGEITVDIDVKSLNRDPITIDEITVTAPKVYVEVNAQAQTNVLAVKNAVEKYQGSTAPQERKQDGGFEKRFIIDKFVFEEGAVDVDATAMGAKESIALELPPVRLSDVGGPNGATPDGIGKTVSRAFLGAVSDVVANEAKKRAMDKAKEEGKEAAKKVLEKLLN